MDLLTERRHVCSAKLELAFLLCDVTSQPLDNTCGGHSAQSDFCRQIPPTNTTSSWYTYIGGLTGLPSTKLCGLTGFPLTKLN